MKVVLVVLGVVLVAVGGLFIGQGVGTVHGSYMTGRTSYAGLGGVLVAIGLVLLGAVWWAARRAHER